MTSIGEKLRRQRIQRGADLEQITRETKISPRLLEAIEAEEFDKLPGGVFRKRFIEQYARALGIEDSEIRAELEHLFPDQEPVVLPASDIRWFSSGVGRVPTATSIAARRWRFAWLGSFAAVVVVMLACAGIYSWWQNSRRPVSASPPEKVTSTVQNPRSAVSESPTSNPEEPHVSNTERARETEPVLGEASESEPSAQQTAAAPTAPAEAKVRVTITATEASWFSATSDGKLVFTGRLEPNQAMSFYAMQKLKIFTGNAGGLEITLNDRAVGSIGPSGQVRTVYLTPEGFQVLQPKPRTSESL